jgi:hypothetical protein
VRTFGYDIYNAWLLGMVDVTSKAVTLTALAVLCLGIDRVAERETIVCRDARCVNDVSRVFLHSGCDEQWVRWYTGAR